MFWLGPCNREPAILGITTAPPDAYVTPGSEPLGGVELEGAADVEELVCVLESEVERDWLLDKAAEVDDAVLDALTFTETPIDATVDDMTLLDILLDAVVDAVAFVARVTAGDEDDVEATSLNLMAPWIWRLDTVGLESEDFR